MNTFRGRFRHFVSVSAPHRSFYQSLTIKQYNLDVKKLAKEKSDANNCAMLTPNEISDFVHKKTILGSSLSPDTEEPIMWPQRISAFIPTNLPIFAAMLMTAPTTRNIVMWQGIN